MIIQERVNIGAKTTMRIGGEARYYAELLTKADAEAAQAFAREKKLPLIALGGGANTVFADGTIDALVVRVTASAVRVEGKRVTAEAGVPLATLINDCAAQNLDLSPLSGIPGSVGGAIVGNAGQGANGVWFGTYVDHVTALLGGEWRTYPVGACGFQYRDSVFKALPGCIVWDAILTPPTRPRVEVLAEVERLIKKRFETQIHGKTAGSCFKSLPDGMSAWQLIDSAGLRGLRCGDVQISEKHANFLLNAGTGTFRDVLSVIETVREKEPQLAEIEMRLYGRDGCIVPL